MHGLIANQLRSFTVAHYGRAAWGDAVSAAGADLPIDRPPAIDRIYDDGHIVGTVVALARLKGVEVPVILGGFGEYLASALLRVYGPLLRPEWRTLDIVEHVEDQIHTAVRLRDPSAGPPYLRARRVAHDEAEVLYTSPRRLCALGEGIVRGLAAHFEEPMQVSQPECMHRGDAHCRIVVRRASA